MAKTSLFYGVLLSSTMITGMFGAHAFAADIAASPMPAVSAVNGKVEFGGGFADINVIGNDAVLYGAGSLSIPLGDMFGLQGDFAVTDEFGETSVGGAAHLFTRDPNSYLLGAIGGFTDLGSASALWGGGEAELYMNNISLELAAGVMDVNPDVGSNSTEGFVFADLAYYATDNFRLTLGGSSIAGFETGHVAAEYLLDSMPLSIKADLRAGEEGYVAGKIGVSYYFGGNEANKSLIRRHREDDPRNRVLDIFGAGAAGATGFGPNGNVPGTTCPTYYVFVDGEGCVPGNV